MLRRIPINATVTLAVVAVLVAGGCGGCGDDGLIRVRDRTVTSEEIEARLVSHVSGSDRDQVESVVKAEIDRVAVTLWLASEYPVDLSDRVERVRRRHCTDLAIKRWMGSQPGLEGRARAWFDEHRSDYDAPERFVLQTIFLPAQQPGTAALADRLSAELGADPHRFDELARKHSTSETASQGGQSDVIDADRLHPVILEAARRHVDDGSVFRLDLDRGIYLIRVLGHVPAVQATWEAARQRAFDDASRAILDDFARQKVAEFERDHVVRRAVDHLGLIPVVAPSTVVLKIDGVEVTLADLLPVDQLHKATPGPLAEEMVEQHIRTAAAAADFGCDPIPEADDEEMVLAAGVPLAFRRFVSEEMGAEVAAFVDRQQEVMRYPPAFRLTLVALPVGAGDPYEASLQLRRVLTELIASGDARSTDAVILTDLEANENQLRVFDPRLVALVGATPPGQATQVFVSSRINAALGAVVLDRVPPRPLDLNRSEDHDLALDWFLSSERDSVMSAVRRTATEAAEVDQNGVEDLIDRLVACGQETSTSP